MELKHSKSFYATLILMALLMFCSPQVSAQKTKSERVTVDVTAVTIGQLFSQLKKQTGYNFVINGDLAKSFTKVTVKAVNKPVKDVLNEVLERHNCTFDIDGRTVTVIRKADNSRKRVVKGVVRDATGQALPGVPVCIGNSRVCTVTDENGYYTFSIPS